MVVISSDLDNRRHEVEQPHSEGPVIEIHYGLDGNELARMHLFGEVGQPRDRWLGVAFQHQRVCRRVCVGFQSRAEIAVLRKFKFQVPVRILGEEKEVGLRIAGHFVNDELDHVGFYPVAEQVAHGADEYQAAGLEFALHLPREKCRRESVGILAALGLQPAFSELFRPAIGAGMQATLLRRPGIRNTAEHFAQDRNPPILFRGQARTRFGEASCCKSISVLSHR